MKQRRKQEYGVSSETSTIITNYNGPIQDVDCHIHSARYDMVVESGDAVGHPKLDLIRSPTTM